MNQSDRLKEIISKDSSEKVTDTEQKHNIKKDKEVDSFLDAAAKKLKLEPTEHDRVRVSVALEPNTAKFLRRLAKENHTSLSEVVARVAKEFVMGLDN